MIRTAVLALAVSLVLSCSALAVEGDYWKSETGAAAVAKAIDITAHGAEVRAITHDGNIYGRAGTAWSLVYTISSPSGNPPFGGINRVSSASVRNVVWPQLVSFQGTAGSASLYVTRGYMVQQCVGGGSYQHYVTPEYSVLKIDPPNEAVVLMVRGARYGGDPIGWVNHCSYNFFNPVSNMLNNGYLFTVGGVAGTLYWGGGGGGQVNPPDLTGVAAGGANAQYVFKTADGTAWNLVNRTLGNDEFGRPIPAAMPNGYRYNHIVEFGGSLVDYYGWYNTTTLAFTPHPAGSPHTEPWGWFLMGNDGASVYRVAHNKKGDKNFLYQTSAVGGAWALAAGGAAPNNGSVYWRGCAAVGVAQNTDNPLHAGLYCTYSAGTGPGTWESGVYRYFPDDAAGKRTAGWSKVIATADARVYTGAIFIKPNDGIYVGTSTGVIRRGIGTRVFNAGPPPTVENPDPDEPAP